MAELFIHVGYPKCASTFLQKRLLPKQSEICFIDSPQYHNALLKRYYPCGGEQKRIEALKHLSSIVTASNLPVVMSNENLCMPSSWLDTHRARQNNKFSWHESNELIKAYFPKARILIVVRNQQDWICSWYQERIKRVETKSLSQLLSSSLFMDDILPSLCYTKVIEEYSKLFSAKSVKVILFEDMIKDLGCFFSAIGINGNTVKNEKVRSSISHVSLLMRRNTNKILSFLLDRGASFETIEQSVFKLLKELYSYDFIIKKLSNNFAKPNKYNLSLTQEIISILKTDNAKLHNLLGKNFHNYGYLLP